MPPLLLHIGYHKSGSGWLRRLFFSNPVSGFGWVGKKSRDHPVRRLVAARPFEFDAAASRAEFEPLLAKIEAEGLSPVVSFERFSGGPFSGGYDSKEIADRLVEVFPDARILVVVREQRSMLVSTYKQYVREGGVWPVRTFIRPPSSKSMRVPWFDVRHLEYHHLLSYYRQVYGADRVLAMTYEQFLADQAAFAQRIAEFAGRPLTDEALRTLPFQQRSNPSPTAAAIELKRLLNKLGVGSELNPSPLIHSSRIKRLGESVQHTQRIPAGIVKRREAKLRADVAAMIGDRYAESNRITAELLGADLESLGWTM
jgi:Sulfotransferase family